MAQEISIVSHHCGLSIPKLPNNVGGVSLWKVDETGESAHPLIRTVLTTRAVAYVSLNREGVWGNSVGTDCAVEGEGKVLVTLRDSTEVREILQRRAEVLQSLGFVLPSKIFEPFRRTGR